MHIILSCSLDVDLFLTLYSIVCLCMSNTIITAPRRLTLPLMGTRLINIYLWFFYGSVFISNA